MAKITFKAKETQAGGVFIPRLTTAHCDMAAFRADSRFHANAVTFEGSLRRLVYQKFGPRLDTAQHYEGVTFIRERLLTRVEIDI